MMMKKFLLGFLCVAVLAACSTSHSPKKKNKPTTQKSRSSKAINQDDADYIALILIAEEKSKGKVKAVLRETRKMALFEKSIVKGGCWDYLDAAWSRAGVPRQNRVVAFKSTISGPYADTKQLQPGDWLYHVNYSYHNIGHSGMFIGWADEDKKLGVTLSYAGGSRREPARYRIYDLSGVYHIIRAQ